MPASVAPNKTSTIAEAMNPTLTRADIDPPEAEERDPRDELQTTDHPIACGAMDSALDPFPEIDSAPKPDPVAELIDSAVRKAVCEEMECFERKRTMANMAIQYLNCQYAGSSPDRVKVIKAAEDVVLDFFTVTSWNFVEPTK